MRPRCHFKTALLNLVFLIGIFPSSKDNTLRWMPRHLNDDKSTLVQVMAWCRQVTSHYLSQCWHSSISPYGVTRPQWVNCLSQILTLTCKIGSILGQYPLVMANLLEVHSQGSFQYEILSYHYMNSHSKDKTVSRPSYLYYGNPYTRNAGLYIETSPKFYPTKYRNNFFCHL